jgi:hypothetical protein
MKVKIILINNLLTLSIRQRHILIKLIIKLIVKPSQTKIKIKIGNKNINNLNLAQIKQLKTIKIKQAYKAKIRLQSNYNLHRVSMKIMS